MGLKIANQQNLLMNGDIMQKQAESHKKKGS